MDFTSTFLYWTFLPLGGKTLAILGGRAVGKTSFKEFIEKQKVPEDYRVTNIAEQYASFRASDLGIRIKASEDVGGGDDPEPQKAYYDAWEHVVKSSNYVFYLINIQRFLPEDKTNDDINNYKERVNNDLSKIIEWVKREKPIIIVGTHADQDPRFSDDLSAKAANEIKEIQDDLLKDETIIGFCSENVFLKDYIIIIGSLATDNYAKKLVIELKQKLKLVEKISRRNREEMKKENK